MRLKKNKRLTATDIVKNSKLSLDDDKNGPIAADYFDERTSQNKQMDSLEPKKMYTEETGRNNKMRKSNMTSFAVGEQ